MEETIDLQDVVSSLAELGSSKDVSIAYKDALLKSRQARINELEKEVEDLRKELIGKMDEDSEE